jgi:hypothetical protein
VCGSRSIADLRGSGQVQPFKQEGDTTTLLVVISCRIHIHVHESIDAVSVNLFIGSLVLVVLSRVDEV